MFFIIHDEIIDHIGIKLYMVIDAGFLQIQDLLQIKPPVIIIQGKIIRRDLFSCFAFRDIIPFFFIIINISPGVFIMKSVQGPEVFHVLFFYI